MLKEINTPNQNLQCTFEVEQGGIILFLKSGSVKFSNFQAKEILKRNQYPPVTTAKLKKIIKNNSTGKQAELLQQHRN